MTMFETRDDGALPSLADVVGEVSQVSLDEHAISSFSQKLVASQLPVGTTMSAAGDLRTMLERIFYRKFVRDLPEENRSLPFFECHVPPGGSTVVRTAGTTSKSGNLELNLFGSGMGRGRKISVTVSDASGSRTNCAIYSFDLRLKPHVYEIRGRQSIELEIVELLGNSYVSVEKCLHCGIPSDQVDISEYRFEQYLDLRKDNVPRTEKFRLEVESDSSIEGGVKLNSLPVALKLSAKIGTNYSLEVESVFPPGVLYRPYKRFLIGPLQTAMWAAGAN